MFRFSSLSPSLVCRHVLFGFSPDEVRSIPRFIVYMLNVCKFSLGKVRNDFRFRDISPGALEVIEKVKSRVRLLFSLSVFSLLGVVVCFIVSGVLLLTAETELF